MDGQTAPVRRLDSYRDLLVWQKAMTLAEGCCREALAFPPKGYVLATHLQKTAISIPSNLAEGHELQTASYRLHVRIALGSLAELATQVNLARRLGLLSADRSIPFDRDIRELERMLRALRAALSRRLRDRQPTS